MTKPTRIPISRRAMFSRLNRTLEKKGQVVMRPRGRGPHPDGEYFIIDTKHDRAVEVNLSLADLEKMARETGVMRPWEEVER